MQAEFDVEVAIDSGFSGHKLLTSERERELDIEGFSAEPLDDEDYDY